MTEKRIITYLTKDHDARLRDELFRCSLLWFDPDTLVIGWADRFKICKIIRRHSVANLAASGNSGKAANAISAMAATVLSSGAGIASTFVAASSNDKRDFGTHVELSKLEKRYFVYY
jgi:hypothetical protein